MIIIMRHNSSESDIRKVLDRLSQHGLASEIHSDGGSSTIYIKNDGIEIPSLSAINGVERVIYTTPGYKLASRNHKPESSIIEVCGRKIGGDNFCVIAGPCAVEGIETGKEIATLIKSENLGIMRGGAFKPRTSPYSFQGMEYKGLEILAEIKQITGIGIVTEAIDVESVDKVEQVADIIQVGSRNMQNFSLLKRLGKSSKPILLKRGMSATVEELLLSAEYILSGGNDKVILCERGIRSFDTHTRNTLDLSIVPIVKELSHLPIIVDPSHATGKRAYIASMAKAALAAGANGLLIEIHPDPEQSISDGSQSISPDEFKALMDDLRAIASCLRIKIN
jgi:3-deoxy-7-phosphoheptulonate synthase